MSAENMHTYSNRILAALSSRMDTLVNSMSRKTELLPPEKFPYLPGLDGLRAVAVMAVLFYHAEFPWADGGFLGVEVFFVISGYLITSLLLVEWLRTGTINSKRFWLRRARRLLPAVFLLLLTVATYSVLFLRETLYRLGGDILAASAYVTNWLLIFREDSYFEVFGRPQLLQHLWSLSIEEQFYVLWPILLSIGLVVCSGRSRFTTIRRLRLVVIFGAAASTALMALLFTPFNDPSRIYYGTDTRAAGILAGVALALWWMPWRLDALVSRRYRIIMDTAGFSAFGALIVLLMVFNEYSPWLYRGGFALTSLLTVIVIAVIAHPAGGLHTALSNTVMNWIGTRSYGIYLWHWPIFMVTRPGFDLNTGRATTFAIRLGITFAVAELSYRYVETPIRKIGPIAWINEITRGLGTASRRVVVGTATAAILTVVIAVWAMGGDTSSRESGADITPLVAEGEVVGEETTSDSDIHDVSNAIVLATESSDHSLVDTTTPPVSTQEDHADGETGSEMPEDAESDNNPPSGGTVDSQRTLGASEGTDAGVSSGADTSAEADVTTDLEYGDNAPPLMPDSDEFTRLTLIGDSVLQGAEEVVQYVLGQGATIDALVNRQFKHADDVIADIRRTGRLGDVVVVHLGTNGPFGDSALDDLMIELSDVERVIVLTAFVPRRWESFVNETIESGRERWPVIEILDYHSFGEEHPEYYSKDGVHLNTEGMEAYAEFLYDAIAN